MPSSSNPRGIRGVLFDLDGTLLDTAPDMAAALNDLRREHGLGALPLAAIRDHVSHGSTAMVRIGFGDGLAEARFEALRARFLAIYAENLAQQTRLFPGMPEVIDALEVRGLVWGIVTNKPGFLSRPLIEALGLQRRIACLVSGDQLPQRKPHPAPLLHAAADCGLPPGACCYLGDAERDIAAGRAAGMHTLIARWGYIDSDQCPQAWGADAELQQPEALLEWLETPAATPQATPMSR
ncbi:phosphoglycolate phosphatase [Acidihalobacter prosperus]|uniref:phosphoglycolate phosphatase n=1 Tax=Acidihalobacter prosperus TaxID=160660 RepID=A0A1A6C7C5_9GAMM|nr:phosphoglycolate phosphatase [Acidihalobacter prosperus]OBS10468.1 phosphoglycolate phosphatase, bacterial [Acidihalobacter prosperus]